MCVLRHGLSKSYSYIIIETLNRSAKIRSGAWRSPRASGCLGWWLHNRMTGFLTLDHAHWTYAPKHTNLWPEEKTKKCVYY